MLIVGHEHSSGIVAGCCSGTAWPIDGRPPLLIPCSPCTGRGDPAWPRTGRREPADATGPVNHPLRVIQATDAVGHARRKRCATRRAGRLWEEQRMSTLDLARIQFGMTSIYHFLFVPVTIGLAFLTAILQTVWHRNHNPDYLRLTRFFGTLLLINVAVGVVTGLVQESQFGMDWSSYSETVVVFLPVVLAGLPRRGAISCSTAAGSTPPPESTSPGGASVATAPPT